MQNIFSHRTLNRYEPVILALPHVSQTVKVTRKKLIFFVMEVTTALSVIYCASWAFISVSEAKRSGSFKISVPASVVIFLETPNA